MGKMRVKDLGKLKSHKPQNSVKRMNKTLGITRYTLNEILNIIEQSHIEKNPIKESKITTLVRVIRSRFRVN